MPNERVLSLPLSSDEIIEILLQRFEKRLQADCFLHQANTYNGFAYSFELKLTFKDMMLGRETLVWDKHEEAKQPVDEDVQAAVDAQNVHEGQKQNVSLDYFDSGDSPNRVRMDHDLPLPVETTEGRRKVIRNRKV